MLEFLTKHLKEAKQAAGSDNPVKLKDYFIHFGIAIRQGVYDVALGLAGIVHAVFPWWFGFELIDLQINSLKKLKQALPGLPVWDRIEFKD